MPMSSMTFPVVTVAGVPFRSATLDDAVDWLLDAASRKSAHPNVRLANAYNVALAQSDPEYSALLTDSGVNFPDGSPVVWFMNFRARQRSGRVRGPSLFPLALRRSNGRATRHFLLGGAPETLSLLEAKVLRDNPDVILAGTYSPPFAPITPEYIADCAKRVKDSGAEIVWIGLGTPKQDQLGTALAKELDVVTVNVGAAFDFLAGTVREAPEWVQRSGFEWLHRLATEPKRLWRRYLIGNTRFLFAATRGLVSNRAAS